MQMTKAEKARENRLRRLAQLNGMRIERSRCRTPEAHEFGTYHIVDVARGAVVAAGLQAGYGLTLDEVEVQLRGTRVTQQ